MVLSGLDALLDRTSNPEDPDPERLIQTDSCPMSLCLQPIQLLSQLEDMGPSGLDRKSNPKDPERLILDAQYQTERHHMSLCLCHYGC
ncbi:hypothetical protein AVEN_150439-1 [Araneus ventricosus]|uniref:Uncharacterized protein n=1 Tax=Araneus ventricosus TaxID=182803 RepID=A0A4Y2PCX8_ARAVE|nr:hypothetical protein AVEN_150439-1 [Araneus ventricosus]